MYFAPDGNGGYQRSPSKSLFLWGQSVFIIAQLLTAGLLHINELDMIRRYLPSYNRPRKGGRYSAFQVRIIVSNFFEIETWSHCTQKSFLRQGKSEIVSIFIERKYYFFQ